MSEPKRMSVSFPAQIAEKLEWLADYYGCTMSEVINKAVKTESYLQQEFEAGSKLLIEREGERREVVFR